MLLIGSVPVTNSLLIAVFCKHACKCKKPFGTQSLHDGPGGYLLSASNHSTDWQCAQLQNFDVFLECSPKVVASPRLTEHQLQLPLMPEYF